MHSASGDRRTPLLPGRAWAMLAALASFSLSACVAPVPHAVPPVASLPFAQGADASFLGEAEAHGVVFRDQGIAKPGLQIFRDHGYNAVRLRLFHSPSRERTALPNDLAYTIAQAKQAKALGFKFLLDFHYSDTWADPAHQSPPAAWRDLSQAELIAAVRTYTHDCLVAFREADAMPDWVQNGNEVTAGMLWPQGQLPARWDEFAALVRAGIEGVYEGSEGAKRPLILVQIERSCTWTETKWFFDHLLARGIEPDILGQSYYPWWHGSLDDLRTTLHAMAREYRKPVMVVETAYCWRPTEYKGKSAPFPETPAGQQHFLAALNAVVRGIPDGLGVGLFWWEPAVGFGRGRTGLRARGMFDDTGEVLPVIDALR